jgi:hypothetical protein
MQQILITSLPYSISENSVTWFMEYVQRIPFMGSYKLSLIVKQCIKIETALLLQVYVFNVKFKKKGYSLVYELILGHSQTDRQTVRLHKAFFQFLCKGRLYMYSNSVGIFCVFLGMFHTLADSFLYCRTRSTRYCCKGSRATDNKAHKKLVFLVFCEILLCSTIFRVKVSWAYEYIALGGPYQFLWKGTFLKIDNIMFELHVPMAYV